MIEQHVQFKWTMLFYDNVFLFVDLTTLRTFIVFWLVGLLSWVPKHLNHQLQSTEGLILGIIIGVSFNVLVIILSYKIVTTVRTVECKYNCFNLALIYTNSIYDMTKFNWVNLFVWLNPGLGSRAPAPCKPQGKISWKSKT